ncbi:cytochrome b561 domain-containing protein [Xylophilus sp. Leaf220]|uniref:cytochrome b561 domain-containing protein n=1 Tax=Xylophilus sp. Leaf220 TaxID=1735686 RepID=UPI000B272858|nr:cytochrome b561 domain-containing protein [Xylophilus sp. Leaf220]
MDLAACLHWLLAPASGAAEHHIAAWASWHGRLMVLAWAVLLPVGVLVARYCKVTPRQDWPRELDNKAWWHAHRTLQYAGLAAMGAGLWLAWGRGGGATAVARWHAGLGLAVVALGALQALGGWLRGSKGGPTDAQGLRGDHYDMTRRRIAFEVLHKGLGYLALLLAAATVVLGLKVADAPRWMWAGVVLWWAVWIAAFCLLQRQGRCIDTYQAIWGPDDRHPGNRMAPVGWGVRRYDAAAFRALLYKARR